jgi:NAD(P)-dependent dehydrogenase (short-subunit alcohol dehydrogenase family)
MLDGRIILVTNILDFTGQPAARELAARGATVVAHDGAFSDAEARKDFEAENKGMTSLENQDPEACVAELLEKFGQLDVLISNDIGDAKRAKIDEASLDDFRDALESMTVAPFAFARAVVPGMKARQQGKIIFITSATPLKGLPNYAMYVTARGATNALTLTLAHELAGDNIQVNALAPNFVESPAYFPKELVDNPETLARITKNIPLGRLGKPQEVGEAIAFLASDSSNFITGHVMPFAGGWA